MTAPIPLTLIAGSAELSRLVPQLAQPSDRCAVVAPPRIVDVVGSAVAVEHLDGPAPPHHDRHRVRADLVEAIVRVLEHSPSRRVVVALDDGDDAVTAAFTILSDRTLVQLVRLDAVIATVDAVRLATRLASGQPVDTGIGLDRLAIADRILVTRSREVTAGALGAIAHVLRSVNQTGPVIAPAIAPCPLDDLLDLGAWSGRPAFGPPPAVPSPFLTSGSPVTVVCRGTGRPDTTSVEEWLDRTIARHADDLLRLQGAIHVPDRPGRTRIAVRSFTRSRVEAAPSPHPSPTSVVVLIGRDLPADTLQAEFTAAHR